MVSYRTQRWACPWCRPTESVRRRCPEIVRSAGGISRSRSGENKTTKETKHRRRKQSDNDNKKGYKVYDPRYSGGEDKKAGTKVGKYADVADNNIWTQMTALTFDYSNPSPVEPLSRGPTALSLLRVRNRYDKSATGPVHGSSKKARVHDGKELSDGDYLMQEVQGKTKDGTTCRLQFGFRAQTCLGCCAGECPKGLITYDTFIINNNKNYKKCVSTRWFENAVLLVSAFWNLKAKTKLTGDIQKQCPERVRKQCPEMETPVVESKETDLVPIDFSSCTGAGKKKFFNKHSQAKFDIIRKIYVSRYGLYDMDTTPGFTPEQRWNFLHNTFGMCGNHRGTLPMAGKHVKKHWGSDGVQGCEGPCYGEVHPVQTIACDVTYNSLRIEQKFQHLENALAFTVMGAAQTGAPCALDVGFTLSACKDCCCEAGLFKYDVATVALSREGGCEQWYGRASAFANHFLSVRVRLPYMTLFSQRCPNGVDKCSKPKQLGEWQPMRATELGEQALGNHQNFHICK